MASVRKTPGGNWELCIRHKLLPKRIYLTFPTEDGARTYGVQVDALLKAGIVPAGLVGDTSKPTERLSIMLQAPGCLI